jgi:Tol biopolymer transport system component
MEWTRLVLGGAVALGFCSCASHDAPKPAPLVSGEAAMLSDVVQLTSGFDRAGEAYFSPDMRWVIFQATPKGQRHYQMYVAPLRWERVEMQGPIYATPLPMKRPPGYDRLAGLGTPVRVSAEPSRNTCGYFSPDGRSLIFASTAGKEDPGEAESGYQRQGGSYRWEYPKGMEIWRADGWREAVSKADRGKADLSPRRLTDNDAYDAEGAYAPDDKWIVFTSNRTGDLELYAMRPDGTGVTQLTHTPGYDGGAFFSPDGKRLVYRSDRKGNDLLQIFVADVDRDASGNILGLSNERQLTHDANVNWGPFWHPDGRHIIYATSAHGHQNYELYLMRDDGSAQRRVTHWTGFDGLPAFSPDGRWLMWSSKRGDDGTTQVFAARFTLPADD